MLAALATPVAFIFQMTGGMLLTWLTAQVVAQTNGIEMDPTVAMMAAGIGALFAFTTWLIKDRFGRCDSDRKEDTELRKESSTTIRELTGAVTKAADVTLDAVAAANGAVEASRLNTTKHDAVLGNQAAMMGKIDALSTAVTTLSATVDELRAEIRISRNGGG